MSDHTPDPTNPADPAWIQKAYDDGWANGWAEVERRVRETIANDQMAYADTFDRSGPIRAALLHCNDIARGGAA